MSYSHDPPNPTPEETITVAKNTYVFSMEQNAMTTQPPADDGELRQRIANSLGCYYREKTKSYVREVFDTEHKFVKLENFDSEIDAISKLVTSCTAKHTQQQPTPVPASEEIRTIDDCWLVQEFQKRYSDEEVKEAIEQLWQSLLFERQQQLIDQHTQAAVAAALGKEEL